MSATATIFRKWTGRNGGVIALFPTIPGDLSGNCLAYEHDGQHGAADYYGVIGKTALATARDRAALAKELRNIGYQLRIVKRASRVHRNQRMRALRRLLDHPAKD